MAWRSRYVDSARLEALYPGVPSWLELPLLQWVSSSSTLQVGTVHFPGTVDSLVTRLQEYELSTRRPDSLVAVLHEGSIVDVRQAMDEEEWLDFIDFILYKLGNTPWGGNPYSTKLEELLSTAGSEWTVGSREGHPSLVKRVPEGVAVGVAAVIASGGSAGTLLAEAWHAVFGRNPDTEEAYEKAIKAVEEAGAGKVSPKNSKATLGTMVRDMKAQGDWKLPLGSGKADAPVRMAEVLWQGQESRHGGNGYRKPTQEEAEAALLLAAPLVQWFTSGVLTRRP